MAVCGLMKTVMARKLFLPTTFPAHGFQHKRNYGDAVIVSMLEEKDKSEDHGVTTCTQPCTTDETMKPDVDLLLVLLPQTTWKKRDSKLYAGREKEGICLTSINLRCLFFLEF